MNNTANIDSDEMLDMYDDILEQLIQLDAIFPKIREMYDNSKKSLDTLNTKISRQTKTIESQQQTIDKQQVKIAEAEKLLAALTEQIAIAENQKKSIESYLKSIETLTKKASAHLQKKKEESLFALEGTTEECLTKIHAITKKAAASLSFEPEIDYEEIDSIANLYEKFGQYMKNPMLVKRTGWDEDSCFAVKEIKENSAYGDQFKYGKQDCKGISYEADKPYYSMYNGPSMEIVQDLLSKS